jgi:hypothetical protein
MRTCVVLKFSGKFYTYEMFPMVLALITLRFSTLLQLSSGEYMSMQQKKKNLISMAFHQTVVIPTLCL